MDKTEADGTWPPRPSGASDAALESGAARRRPDPLSIVGHAVAVLPLAAFAFTLVWLQLCVYDNNMNVIGPGWVVRLGGASVGFWPLPMCLVGGVACVVAGIIRRRGMVAGEGAWACLAACVLYVLYEIALS